MTPREMGDEARRVIESHGEGGRMQLVIPGKRGRTNRKRLWPGGPTGTVVGPVDRGLLVDVYARDILNALIKGAP